MSVKRLGTLLGPIAFFIVMFLWEPSDMNPQAKATLASTLWVAIWWITEAMPISVTALLPILLFPLSGAMEVSETTSAYGHPFIFLFLGGFVIGKALERWDLHRRIALTIIYWIGSDVRKIILGFMVATAFLSMWISNTATSVMMLPIGLAVARKMDDDASISEEASSKFGKGLMLAIAYSASIGGIATLIGTPPNLVLAGIMEEMFEVQITFQQWMMIGLPFSILMLLICWQYLTRFAFPLKGMKMPGGKVAVKTQLEALGKISYEEKAVGLVFALTAFAWVTKSFLLEPFMPIIDDTLIALAGGISLFLIPSRAREGGIILWKEAVTLPWGVLLLYGGGLSIAAGFQSSGLALYIGEQMTVFDGLHLVVLIFLIVLIINFLTEITSNLATTAMLLPILGALAISIEVEPYLILIPATIAASCAFMLPVATPPNAVVFGSGKLQMNDMVKTGLLLNIFSVLLITVLSYFFLPWLWK